MRAGEPRAGRRLRLGLILALILAGGLAREARGQIVHVVEKGDTLPRLAQLYYGSGKKASYLAGVNQIPLDGKLKPGQRLKVAVVWTYRVRRGDRLAAIARKVLGDERRYPYLARFNDIEEVGRLAAGTRLLIPIEIRHRAVRGENLGIIAKRYYRNTRKAKLLRDYNFIGKKGFSTGDLIIVPIFDKTAELSEVKRRMNEAREAAARLAAAKAARKAKTTAGKKAPAPVSADETADPPEAEAAPKVDLARIDFRLGRAEKQLRRGDYEESVEALDALMEEVPEDDLERQHRLRLALATTLVALGRRGEATGHLQRLIELDPDTTLDPVHTSPKVMEAFQRAQEAWSEDSGDGARGSRAD